MSAHLRRRIAELDAQIVDQRRVLDELQQTRSDVEGELHGTETFPVLRLPTEITAENFEHCDPLSEDLESGPVVLASVCRLWRNIALGTPILWSNLQFVFDSISSEMALAPGFVEGLIDQWFARAGNHSLSLSFYLGEENNLFALSRLRAIIHRWSHRVRSFELDIGSHDFRSLRLDSAAFPLLQSATLEFYSPELNLVPVAVFGDVPHLHELKLSWCILPSILMLPWLQLTKIEAVLSDLALFALAPNLTEMTCSFEPFHSDFIGITHRSLRSLTITEDSSTDILQFLTIPALQYLKVPDLGYG
ncbi:hypothetical protein K438DRAFT_1956049 [Mycena galopus ATCC 62051]|nr:hypothetical protein K438DRAFT_1956049 [Mycena galopus ATCC 62051]